MAAGKDVRLTLENVRRTIDDLMARRQSHDLYGLNHADKFILAIVLMDGNRHEGPFCVRQPFTQESDWEKTSKNLDMGQLLADAVALKVAL